MAGAEVLARCKGGQSRDDLVTLVEDDRERPLSVIQ